MTAGPVSLRRRALSVIVLIATIVSSGCWDRREINTLAIVSNIGIDRSNAERMRLTVQVASPRSSGGGQEGSQTGSGQAQVSLVQAEGSNPFEAMDALTLGISRRPLLSHQKVLVLGRPLAESGVNPVLDYFLRDPEPRETIRLAVSSGTAASVLEAMAPLGRNPATGLGELLEIQGPASEAAVVNMLDFAELLMSDAAAAYAPIIEVVPGPQGAMVTRLSGTAVFAGDKMAGALSQQQTRGLLWVRGRETIGSLTVPGEGGRPRATLWVTVSRTTVIPRLDVEGPRVDITVTIDADLQALTQSKTLTDQSDVVEMEAAGALAVKGEIQAAITAAQEMRADIFGFADAFHRSFRQEWREMSPRWSEEFAHLKVNIRVLLRLRRLGLLLRSRG